MIKSQYSPSSRALENKIVKLARALEQKSYIFQYSTEDEYMAAINDSIWQLYTYLRKAKAEDIKIKFKDILSPSAILNLLQAISDDLDHGYSKIGETQDEILRRYNRYANFGRDVKNRLQHANNLTASVSRILEDNTFEISDSFADSTLLAGPTEGGRVLFGNNEAGILTLPQIITTNIPIATIRILNSSNGQELEGHTVIDLFDNNLDTWFEYRRTGELDNDPLILELLISLRTVQIINQVQIFPLLLDDRAFPKIADISTSLDGRTYESIKSSIPTFLTQAEEEAMFTLGPIGFRNQEYADFTFTPRTCQFIKLKIYQGKRIFLGGEQTLRLALRDIKVNQIEYEDIGEQTSRLFPLVFTPRKLKLIERTIDTAPLTNTIYQVSFDDGAQWHDLNSNSDIKINTGGSDAINLASEAKSVRVRIIAERDKANFNGLARPLAQSIRTLTNRISLDGVPADIVFDNTPIEDSILISRPVASVGNDFAYPLTRANGEPDLTINVPIKMRTFSETVKVNGQAWTRVANFAQGGPQDRWYTIDYPNQQIRFSDNRLSMIPEGEITLQLEAEPVLLPDSGPLIVDLDNAHDFNREHTKIYWYDRIKYTKEEGIGRGVTKYQLDNSPVIQYLDVIEELPSNVSSFYLDNIPLANGELIFSDKSRFATLVTGTPAAYGEYSVTQLVSGTISPIYVQVYGRTDINEPGSVTMEARARILSPQTTYNAEQWLKDIGYPSFNKLNEVLETYYVRFSDTTVYKTEKTFVDGITELTQAGDYSIDYPNGVIYSFAPTPEAGITYAIYVYQNRKALNWDFINENPKQLLIKDDSFLVAKNDQFSVILLNSNSTRSYVVYKNKRYIRIPLNQTSPYTDTGFTFDFTSEDFIKGYLLPQSRTRVRLPHGSIVKNSVRFIFLSDDINSFDDRIVTRSSTGLISVSPKPIRDVYGNALDGIGIGARTQRDIDKLKLVREKIFIDGLKELEEDGDYSIDYENGILFTYNPIPDHTIIQYEFADVRVSYVATQVLNLGDQYTLDLPKLALRIISFGDNNADISGTTLLLRYDVIDQLREDPSRIYRFYSPILMGYQLKIKS